jgi:2,4-dienoyl-CoA reductase (NADPH2)
MSPSPYPHLLSPVDVGHLTLPNRIVMGSMHTGLEDRTRDLPKLAAYFAERAKGGTALMITGGYAPSWRGWLTPAGSMLATRRAAYAHRTVTDAVHEHGSRIVLQVLHAGRYAYHPLSQSASARKSPITPFRPRAMSSREVERTVDSFARAAELAKVAGYDGVEVMGSEGYLINQFLASRTNDRTDAWGGSSGRRMRFPEEIVRRTRDRVGEDFVVIYRMSLLDLVEDAQSWDETVELAQRVEVAGASLINTGIGWHEARIPTIVTSVPRAAFSWVTAKLRPDVGIPVMASNRINTPDVAERILAEGEADLVSMARPLLADPAFVSKAEQGRADEINTCIACNQACLDHAFARQPVSCLVNPRAGRESELFLLPVPTVRRRSIAVVGAGPADSPARPRSPSAATPSTCSRGRPSWAGSSGWRWRCRARRSSPRPCATTPAAWRPPVYACTRRPASAPTICSRTTTWCWPRASCHGCRPFPASTTPAWSPTPTCCPADAAPASGSR